MAAASCVSSAAFSAHCTGRRLRPMQGIFAEVLHSSDRRFGLRTRLPRLPTVKELCGAWVFMRIEAARGRTTHPISAAAPHRSAKCRKAATPYRKLERAADRRTFCGAHRGAAARASHPHRGSRGPRRALPDDPKSP